MNIYIILIRMHASWSNTNSYDSLKGFNA